eukprot:SAG31_NODE_30763_length_376_cov_1.010830_1_plen_105_part_00
MQCHVVDGAKFIADADRASYDLICIDAADHDANDEGPDLEAPPECLSNDAFLRGPLRRALRKDGLVAVNAIGRRDQWSAYVDAWKHAGFSPVYVLDIDPNIGAF